MGEGELAPKANATFITTWPLRQQEIDKYEKLQSKLNCFHQLDKLATSFLVKIKYRRLFG